jgi:hypothetical protein
LSWAGWKNVSTIEVDSCAVSSRVFNSLPLYPADPIARHRHSKSNQGIDMTIQTGFRLAMSAFAIACAAGAAHAQVSKTVINTATVPKYPPFEFRDPTSNKLIGFDVDIVDALAAKMGAKSIA